MAYILGRKKFRRLFFRVGGRAGVGVGDGVPGPHLHPPQGNLPALLCSISCKASSWPGRSPARPPPSSRPAVSPGVLLQNNPSPARSPPLDHPTTPAPAVLSSVGPGACALKTWRGRGPFRCGAALVRGPAPLRGCSLRAQGGTLHTNAALPRLAGPGPLDYPPRPGRLYLPGVCVALMPAAWCP